VLGIAFVLAVCHRNTSKYSVLPLLYLCHNINERGRQGERIRDHRCDKRSIGLIRLRRNIIRLTSMYQTSPGIEKHGVCQEASQGVKPFNYPEINMCDIMKKVKIIKAVLTKDNNADSSIKRESVL